MRAESAEIAECFDEVGLALAVAANEKIWPAVQLEISSFVITKIRERQMRDDHARSLMLGVSCAGAHRSRLANRVPTKLLTKSRHCLHRW
jgi:hypothetical protein